MLRMILFGGLLALVSRAVMADSCSVTFIVTIPDSLPTDAVFITGNVAQLGNWQPNQVKMERTGQNRYEVTLMLPCGAAIEYKFTRGSWDNEEVLSDGTVPTNKALTVSPHLTVRHEIAGWRDRRYRVTGGIVGTLHYHYQFHSPHLSHDRTIVVWLPPSYDSDPNKRYPVLYMHDGQNLFDPRTSFLGVDWQMDETADSLIRQGKMEEIIIVGLYNTADRLEEYADTKKGRAYMDFVVTTVKPFIDTNYRTLSDREHTAIMGSSMGGLISFYLVWRYPHIFSKAGCLSTSLLWKNGALLKEIENFTGQKPEIKIYLDSSGKGAEGRMRPEYLRLKDLLVSKGFVEGKDLIYYFDEQGDHSERSWSKRVWRPLIFLFGT